MTIVSVFCLALFPAFHTSADDGTPKGESPTSEQMAAWFKEPPAQYRSRPLYWLNGKLDSAVLRDQIQAMRDQCGFGGFAPLPMPTGEPKYLTDGYFERYGEMLKMARELGLKVILYDDIDFPTGSAGGRMAERYPGDMLKNLRKEEKEFSGPQAIEWRIPQGVLMAAVAMETKTLERRNLAGFIEEGVLRWEVPAGNWKVMLFLCVTEGKVVDYLDPDAVERFISLTYEEYAKRFGPFFGDTITMSFFDDLALVYTSGGRTWATAFNTKFQAKQGSDPALLYPALWYDIGPDTEAARVALLGMRAELMAEGFVRTVQKWCSAHGIQVSGHPAGNYAPQPVEVGGDNIKFYKYCDIPLLDSIHYYGHGRDGFKLPISAAFNYDRPLTAVEIYGNYPDSNVDKAMLYRSAMELYVRGANLMIPHGMWLDPATMHIPPEISHRSPRLGSELPAYNQFVGRCSLLLQGGRHVADIGVLYPVQALEAAYRFDVPGIKQPNWGYDAPPEADYLKISDRLTGRVRRDFTFLHPEIIDERCRVEDATLRLNNAVNWEEYRVVLIPGGKVISWKNLQKIEEFYNNGGQVVATTQLPFKSSEFGHDADVQRTIETMFGLAPQRAAADASNDPYHIRLEVSGSTVKTYIQGDLVDVTEDATFAKGTIGFREAEDGGERGRFSHLKVTSLGGQVLFEDDFSKGLGKWVNTGNATLQDGGLTLEKNQAMRARGGAAWSDFIVEVDLGQEEPAGLVFRASEEGKNGYMWQFWPKKGTLRPHKRVNGEWRVLKDVSCSDREESLQPFRKKTNPQGGRAYYAPKPTAATLQAILDEALPVGDVIFEDSPQAESGGGMLSYLHKVKDGADVYYFANSSSDRVETWVRLRGKRSLQQWDPHSGAMTPVECSPATEKGQEVTRVRLVLDPVKSVFLTGPTPEKNPTTE
jgi:hypothetical protein